MVYARLAVETVLVAAFNALAAQFGMEVLITTIVISSIAMAMLHRDAILAAWRKRKPPSSAEPGSGSPARIVSGIATTEERRLGQAKRILIEAANYFKSLSEQSPATIAEATPRAIRRMLIGGFIDDAFGHRIAADYKQYYEHRFKQDSPEEPNAELSEYLMHLSELVVVSDVKKKGLLPQSFESYVKERT